MINSVKTAEFEMEYLKFGCGKRTLVIIPGLSLKSTLLSSDAIKAQFKIFTETHTVYLFERRKNLPDAYSVSDMADDTAQAMILLGIKNADIFGVSQGGMIAQLIAARHPELIKTAVFASTLLRQNVISKNTFGKWVELNRCGKFEELNRYMFSHIYSKQYFEKYRTAFDALAKSGSKADFRRLEILSRACLEFDGAAETPKIKCPVFAISSMKDEVLGYAGAVEIAEKTEGEYYLYENYSHAVYDEAPDFLPRVYEFIMQKADG